MSRPETKSLSVLRAEASGEEVSDELASAMGPELYELGPAFLL